MIIVREVTTDIMLILKIPKVEWDPNEVFLHLLEFYIDDFLALSQSTNKNYITKLTKSLLNAISDIFPPPLITGSKMGLPISVKKLIVEGTWIPRKEILGWLLDGVTLTIELPTTKCNSILAELRAVRQLTNVPITCLRQL